MKWLLSKLGLLKQHKKTQGLKDDLSFFKTSLQTNAIACQWLLRKQTQFLLSQSKGAALMIRIRDASGDGTVASKLVELSLKACLLYTSPSPRDKRQSRMPSSA